MENKMLNNLNTVALTTDDDVTWLHLNYSEECTSNEYYVIYPLL